MMKMYSTLMKLMVSKKLEFVQGDIVLFGDPIMFLHMASLKQMTEDAMERGKRAISDLYFYGWVYGYAITKSLVRGYKLRKFEDRYKVSMDLIELIGLGTYTTLKFKRGEFSKFKNHHNPFGLMFYPRKEPVDHYLRGMNAGGGTVVHEILMDCVELECTAQNKKHCLFLNVTDKLLRKLDKKLVRSQLDIDYLRKRQKEVIRRYGDQKLIPIK